MSNKSLKLSQDYPKLKELLSLLEYLQMKEEKTPGFRHGIDDAIVLPYMTNENEFDIDELENILLNSDDKISRVSIELNELEKLIYNDKCFENAYKFTINNNYYFYFYITKYIMHRYGLRKEEASEIYKIKFQITGNNKDLKSKRESLDLFKIIIEQNEIYSKITISDEKEDTKKRKRI